MQEIIAEICFSLKLPLVSSYLVLEIIAEVMLEKAG